jgi:hypothetical protein
MDCLGRQLRVAPADAAMFTERKAAAANKHSKPSFVGR